MVDFLALCVLGILNVKSPFIPDLVGSELVQLIQGKLVSCSFCDCYCHESSFQTGMVWMASPVGVGISADGGHTYTKPFCQMLFQHVQNQSGRIGHVSLVL